MSTETTKRRVGRPPLTAEQRDRGYLTVCVPSRVKNQIQIEADRRGISVSAFLCSMLCEIYADKVA